MAQEPKPESDDVTIRLPRAYWKLVIYQAQTRGVEIDELSPEETIKRILEKCLDVRREQGSSAIKY